ncbi:hypothetical protein NYP18_00180 [Corynebacterium sp. YIM 101645]|uniref:MBL fold metallo-hydrolase n=1 Tax=Corynebacterium lemuris TaxID=1859292 RepID=A0ABT2FTE1_9CORY|nr:hypothetical protein [Corynebacterium lemuris]MCS5478070.1 hypothetical protein [Corynebacterium lemuris]
MPSHLTEPFPGLYITRPTPLPFMTGVDVRSYVLAAQQGPAIIYNTPGIDDAAAEIRNLGTPTRLLLNHHHETMYGNPELSVPAWIHERDRTRAEESMTITGTFTAREKIGQDLEVIPSPSHTDGTTFFLWDNGQHHFLFPGDALWVEGGTWKAVILGESDPQGFLDTLALMHDLDFDVLVPWHAPRGTLPYDVVTPERKREQVDNLITRIEAGASGVRA